MITLSRATYQGYECFDVRFRRSAGFSPEFGTCTVRLEDIKALKIVPRAIPWRAANGVEFDGYSSVRAAVKMLKRKTLTAPGPLGKPEGGGLNLFGELFLATICDVENKYKPVKYSDIFVHTGGIQEVYDDLNAARSHTTGLVLVPLTDIRFYYTTYGCFAGRINYRLRGNRPDASSINPDTGDLWTFKEVLDALFTMLPGSPIVSSLSECFQKKLPPPTDIEAEGEPVVQILQRLLDKYGLVAQLQPDNNYLVSQKLSKAITYGIFPGFFPTEKRQPVTDYPDSYQKKTTWTNVRPPSVMVLGKRVVQRITVPCVPVIKAEDGRWYQLYQYLEMINYPLASFLKQVLAGHERNFEDVQPALGAPPNDAFSKFLPEYLKNTKAGWSGKVVANKDAAVHARRVEALRQYAFKAYAPLALFLPAKGAKGSVISMGDRDFDRVPWLPLLQAPMYTEEIKNLGAFMPPAYPEKGDLDSFSMEGPVVWARSIGQHFVDDIKAAKLYVGAMGVNIAQVNIELFGKLRQKEIDQYNVGTQLEIIQKTAAATMKGAEGGVTVKIEGDVAIVKANGVGADLHKDTMIQLGEDAANVNKTFQRLTEEIKATKEQIDANRLAMAAMEVNLKRMVQEYEQLGAVQTQKANIPYGVIQGGYSLDPTTGIITFARPMCWMQQPFLLDGDTGIAICDGGVTIMAGYERKTNQITDWTAPVFSPEDKDVDPKVLFVGIAESTVIKCPTVRSPGLQLYCTDEGTPMNLSEVVKDAQALVEGQLRVDRVVDGYRYDIPGFVPAGLDGGCQSVQYTYDGDEAMTYINVNGPNMPMPLGPNFTRDVATPSAQTRDVVGMQEAP